MCIRDSSYQEIADMLSLPIGTVRSRIHRGRAQLRTALEHRRPRRPDGDRSTHSRPGAQRETP